MAHFAELNSSNEVLQVVVISNDDVDAIIFSSIILILPNKTRFTKNYWH